MLQLQTAVIGSRYRARHGAVPSFQISGTKTATVNSLLFFLVVVVVCWCGARLQVMVDPRRVFELGIHHVSRSAGDAECPVLHVDPRDAFVRHYRQCVRDFDAQMDCSRQCLDDELATSRRIAVVRRRTRRVIDTLLHRS